MRHTNKMLLGAAGAAFTAVAASAGAPAVDLYLTVLHNADGESQLINAGAGALADFGGVARFKTLVDNLKAQALVFPAGPEAKGFVMLSAGDNFLAGPELNASFENGIPFYDTLAMQAIGYDAACLGNHEFDFNPDVLEDFLVGFTAPLPFLSSNLDFTGEPGLQALVTAGRIAKSTVVTVAGRQIGIIGATTTDLPFISTPRNVIVNAVLPAVQAEVTNLQNLGVNKIILISHLQGLVSEAALIPMLSGVDIVVGGGGGELLANPGTLLVPGDTASGAIAGLTGTGYPRTATDLDGKTVQVVGTRGDYRYVGRLVVGFDAAGEIVTVDASSNPVRVSGIAPDAVPADPTLQATVVDPVAASVAALAATVIGTTQEPLDGRTTEVRRRETNLGNLVADSFLFNASVLAPFFGAPVPDVALQNGGGMRNNSILPVGNFTELNTFEVLPFANFLSVVRDVPPAQFKEILENAVSRINVSGNGRFAQIAGFRFSYNLNGTAQQVDNNGNVTTPGNRVRNVVLDDGRVIVSNGVVNPNAGPINVATIDFLARGGDQYPFRGRPFTNLGISYQQSLDAFITGPLNGQITSREYKAGGEGRIREVTSTLLLRVLENFGQHVSERTVAADVNLDGVINTGDLAEALRSWGKGVGVSND